MVLLILHYFESKCWVYFKRSVKFSLFSSVFVPTVFTAFLKCEEVLQKKLRLFIRDGFRSQQTIGPNASARF